ncbi:hypothetical protein SpCBS45565_g00906 [Spizellomyces sp. 'palustris']|nr:hypothetical protein SpCBS45565_g00906 [Spizellomyces sp. 'palustris']
MPCPDELEDFFGSLPNDYAMDDLNMAYPQASFDHDLLMHTIPLTLPTMSSSGYVPSPALSTTSLYANASMTLPQYTCQPLSSSMIFSNGFPSPPNPPSDHERILSPCTMYDAVDGPPSPTSDASGGMSDIPLYAETASDPTKLGSDGAPPPRGRSKKTFPCTVCGRRFTRNYNLRESMTPSVFDVSIAQNVLALISAVPTSLVTANPSTHHPSSSAFAVLHSAVPVKHASTKSAPFTDDVGL